MVKHLFCRSVRQETRQGYLLQLSCIASCRRRRTSLPGATSARGAGGRLAPSDKSARYCGGVRRRGRRFGVGQPRVNEEKKERKGGGAGEGRGNVHGVWNDTNESLRVCRRGCCLEQSSENEELEGENIRGWERRRLMMRRKPKMPANRVGCCKRWNRPAGGCL